MLWVKNAICIIHTNNSKILEIFYKCTTAAKLIKLPFLSEIGLIIQRLRDKNYQINDKFLAHFLDFENYFPQNKAT